MINACYNCGSYRPDKVIDPDGPYAVCPQCGHRHAFLQLPLLIIAGASGTGKSTVGQHLLGQLREVVVLEADILWRAEFDQPQEKYRDFFETWLRMCKNISQAGRSVALLCAGGIPENIEPCVERRYFSTVHYLALVCEDQELAERLQGRPVWRNSSDPAYIAEHVQFNQWFKNRKDTEEPVIELLNTSGMPPEKTAEQVTLWICKQLRFTE